MPEQSRMEKVKAMIKKNLPTKASKDCFEGCAFYIDEHCMAVRTACVKGMDEKFGFIQDTLKTINDKIDQIIGNGNGNGKS